MPPRRRRPGPAVRGACPPGRPAARSCGGPGGPERPARASRRRAGPAHEGTGRLRVRHLGQVTGGDGDSDGQRNANPSIYRAGVAYPGVAGAGRTGRAPDGASAPGPSPGPPRGWADERVTVLRAPVVAARPVMTTGPPPSVGPLECTRRTLQDASIRPSSVRQRHPGKGASLLPAGGIPEREPRHNHSECLINYLECQRRRSVGVASDEAFRRARPGRRPGPRRYARSAGNALSTHPNGTALRPSATAGTPLRLRAIRVGRGPIAGSPTPHLDRSMNCMCAGMALDP